MVDLLCQFFRLSLFVLTQHTDLLNISMFRGLLYDITLLSSSVCSEYLLTFLQRT